MTMRGCAGGCGNVVDIGVGGRGWDHWKEAGWRQTENGDKRPDFWCPACAANRVVPGAPVVRGRPPREAVVAVNGHVVGSFSLKDLYEGAVGGTSKVELTVSVWVKPEPDGG